MDNSVQNKIRKKHKRKLRVRRRVRGQAGKPRLSVVKTNAHIHLQVIDDENGFTLVSASTLSKVSQGTDTAKKNKTSAKQLGLKIAQLAKEKNVNQVVFDRGASKYHGVIAAVAEGAREGGLEF